MQEVERTGGKMPDLTTTGKRKISYRYAHSAESSVPVDACKLSRPLPAKYDSFSCLGCGEEMVPKLGTKNVHHFAHKQLVECSPETYLHKLGKTVFFQAISAAIQKGRPFYIDCVSEQVCDKFEHDFGIVCKREVTERIDLTRYFQEPLLEKDFREFRPDILLRSTRGDELFVEIAVTHECDSNKIDSGTRIIEINIQSEEDLRAIAENGLEYKWGTIRNINFQRHTIRRHCKRSECNRSFYFFFVHKSGKCIAKPSTMEEATEDNKKYSPQYMKLICSSDPGSLDRNIFRSEVRQAARNGVAINNCFMCRYHGLDGIDEAIFCKVKKTPVPSNYAADCEKYKFVESERELTGIDHKNDEYINNPKTKSRNFYRMLRGF